MMPAIVSCPDPLELQQLLLGQSPPEQVAGLEEHVRRCAACSERLSELTVVDELVELLRDVPSVMARLPRGPEIDDLRQRVRQLSPETISTGAGTDTAGGTPDPSRCGQATDFAEFLAPAQRPGELGRLGAWRVLRLLGTGGMGGVFLAEDSRLKRPAALKLIVDVRFVDAYYLARFQREAESLARLRHPNIVQIYEVGEHRGRPFLALEYVPGNTLAHHLAATPQPIAFCAELVRTLAEAVQYAHQQGVVHRDLKPANVLIEPAASAKDGAEPAIELGVATIHPRAVSAARFAAIPKIVDFGLSKRLDETGLTHTGELVGTPGYMAPELTRGEPVTGEIERLVDIYSLGCILYEMLTGQPPFRGATVLETLDQVRTRDPIAPSRLQPKLSPEIETICLKCLEKDPRRRYATAQELADDLRRFSNGEPIRARPATTRERFVKWVRRKPALAVLVAASGVFVVSLVVIVLIHNAALRVAASEALRQQQRAVSQYREARETLRRMLDRAGARGGEGIPKLQELRREQQEDALAFFLRISEQHGDDPDVRFDVAQALFQAGLIQSTLGRSEEAITNLKRAEREFASLTREFPNRADYRLHYAQTLKVLGGYAGLEIDEAEIYLQRAFELTNELARTDPKSEEYLSAEADARITLGSFHFSHRGAAGFVTAEEQFRRAAAIYQELIDRHPDDPRFRFVLAKAYLNLSVLMQNTSRPAQEFHDKAEATLEQVYRDDPNGDVAEGLAVLRVNWAYVQIAESKQDEAIDNMTKNVVMLSEMLEREPNHAMLRDRLYRTYGMRAELLSNQDRFAESADDWQKAIDVCPEPEWLDTHRLVMAMALAKSGQSDRAVAVIDEWNSRSDPSTPADWYLHCAKVYAIALENVRGENSLEIRNDGALADRYRANALEFLRRAKHSLGTTAWQTESPGIRNDPAFKPLGETAEFQGLLKPDP